MLDAEQLAAWDRDGFLVISDFVSRERCDRLRVHVESLLAGIDPHADGSATVFSTDDQSHARDEWFLDSGDKVRWFFEDGAFVDGELTRPLPLAVNKLGHAMHDLDPEFSHFSRATGLAELVAELGFTDPRLLQSMYIFKQPAIGGEVSLHCDHTFLWTDPQSVVGFWFAIEDATLDNGCLWAVPGGHRIPVKDRFRLDGTGGASMESLDPEPYLADGLVPLEVEAGTLIVLHGTLPHWSAPNTSDRSRHAYTLHVIEGTADYPADNWLQRRADMPLRGFT